MSSTLWLEPLDVLYLRGNRLFGEAGDDAQAVMPPWPSVAAGAIRSRMLVDHRQDLRAFAANVLPGNTALAAALGTPAVPGTFRLRYFGLAQWRNSTLQPLLALPADCSFIEQQIHQAQPVRLPSLMHSALLTPATAVLRRAKAAKAQYGYHLNHQGMAAYFRGEPLIVAEHAVANEELWKSDARLGIGMNEARRTTAEGRIYTSDAIALQKDVGFVAIVDGADNCLPQGGLLRFGGDGRAMHIRTATVEWPQPDWQRIEQQRSFKLLLTTPGIFADGWQLPGMREGRWHYGGGSARLLAANVARAEVVSGWDLAAHQPKAAERVAPAGSVYWMDDWRGDTKTLMTLISEGLPCDDVNRRAEGFNQCAICNWQEGNHV